MYERSAADEFTADDGTFASPMTQAPSRAADIEPAHDVRERVTRFRIERCEALGLADATGLLTVAGERGEAKAIRDSVRDMRAYCGVHDGVFKVDVDDLLVDLFGSLVIMAIFMRLEGEASTDAGARAAEHQLRMLGVPPARAKRVAWRELTPLCLAA